MAGVCSILSYQNRISKTVNGITTHYAYDGSNVIAEYNDSGTMLRRYIYGPGIDEPMAMIDETSGEWYFYHTDALGSVVAVYNAYATTPAIVEEYVYDVYGSVTILDASGSVITSSAINNPYMYTGRRYDEESGLYYFRARYYDASIGCFLSVDPLGYVDGMNLYTYVSNNPLAYIDPFGLQKQGLLDKIQSALGYAGMAPVIGIFADAANTGISIGRGDWKGAGFNALAMIPGVGQGASGARIALASSDILLTGAKYGDEVAGVVGRVASKVKSMRKLPKGGCFVAGTLVLTSNGLLPIESISVGDRVPTADNQSGITVEPEVEKSYCLYHISMSDPGGSGDVIEMECLRTPEWAEEVGAVTGANIAFSLPEMGLYGLATIVDVQDCPPITSGPGRLALSTITRCNACLYELWLDSAEVPIILTCMHRLYSETKKDWILAEQLIPGEMLRTINGPTEIASIESISGLHRVYNLEVDTDHCYYVSEQGILSHNARPCRLRPHPDAKDAHTTFRRDKAGNITTYETWKPNPKHPGGFDSSKRVDISGGPHTNKISGQDIPTPHVHGKNIPGGVRPAIRKEIP